MDELNEAPSTSSKMDLHDQTFETADDSEDNVNIKLPEQLQKIVPAEEFVSVRHRWNTNEEIASILIAFDKHKEWLVLPQKIRPASGSMLLYNRKLVFYRRDGYCWKKRRNGSTIREDHMKLKVQGLECIYGSYVHSAILPTFHRRCYWLLQNPNIVLIHYLNVPYPEAAKPSIPSLSYELRQKDWTKEELVDQLRPMLSQVTQGTELDVEEDQKVEKLLEEILPFLMPTQENNKNAQTLQRLTRPLAPAPMTATHLTVTNTVSSSPISSTTASLKRPVRKQLRTDEPQPSCNLESLQNMGLVPQGVSPSLLPQHVMLAPQQSQSLQQPQCSVPNFHSLNGHSFLQKNSQSPLIISTAAGHIFGAENLMQGSGSSLPLNQQKNMSDVLNHSLASTINTPRFVTIGPDMGVTNSSTASCNETVSSIGMAYTQSNLLPALSPFSNKAVNSSTFPTNPSHSSSPEAPSSSPIKNESQTSSGAENSFHFPQQHLYQLVAQQNHSFPQDNSQPQQMQQHGQGQTPVLTLHLKPTGMTSPEGPGFVLSLQGATIVSQHKDQPELSSFTTNSSSPLSFSNNQGVVLVASQSPTGGLVLNRVSPSFQPITSSFAMTTSSSQQSFSSANVCSSEFVISTASPMTSSHYTQPLTLSDNNLSQGFTYSTPAVQKSGNPHVNPFSDIFSTTMTNSKPFPAKLDNEMFPVNSSSIQFSGHYSDSKDNNIGLQASSFDSLRKEISMASYDSSSSVMSSLVQPSYTGAVSGSSTSPSTVFCLQQNILQSHHPQTVCDNHQAKHDTVDLMAGPSGNICVKDMITNPSSCDTLDGSFSSLPSADLNLDDLLDLNDLDDVSDLGCSPFTPSDISDQALGNSDLVLCDQTGSGSGINLSVQGQDAMSGHLSPFACDPLGCHQPSSSHQTQSPHLQLNALNNQGRNTVDPEINSVIKDFSPDWAYTKTNTKILVAGPWVSQDACYTCVFDGEHVPALLLQPGLLRCYTQYHPPGFATLQVARNGVIISNLEVFEFCDKEQRDDISFHPEWFAIDSNQLKQLLLERLDHLCRHFVQSVFTLPDIGSVDNETLETLLVQQVQSLLTQRWSDSNLYPKAGQHNLTLLHLASGLGYAKFISCLIRWRMENTSVALEFEIDAQSVDSHACTPLMWACALGKIDAALTLYHWNPSPLKMCNKDGHLPLALARQRGHYNLANQVEQLERAKEQLKEQSSSSVMDTTCLQTSLISSHPMATATDYRPIAEDRKDDSELKDELTVPPTSFPKPGKPGPKLIRRYSEQVISQQIRTLSKRNSIDILPSGQDVDHVTIPTIGSPLGQPIRETNSEPHLPVSPDMAFVAPPAPRLLLEDEIDEPTVYPGEPSTSKMDTDEVCARANSPIIDVERISSDEEVDSNNKDGSKHQMVTLANQIIAAIPERIKLSPPKGDDVDDASSGRGRSESHSSLPSQGSPRPSSFGDDSGISTPMTDSLAFEEYRYPEFGTPASSLSPDSTCLPSPYSPYSFTLDSPPPTTAEFTEYFNAPTTYMEKDFSQLTLSDQEQRKLYEAAKVIQNAYRHYRDKQQQQQQQLQQQKEIEAAILIQSYYRRYKTYAYYKKMSHAAVLIQNQFRTYYAKRKKRGDTGATPRRESERLKKGRNQSVIIQQRFRSHYQRRSLDGKEGIGQTPGSGEAPDSSPPPPKGNFPDESPQTEVEAESGRLTPKSSDMRDTGREFSTEDIRNVQPGKVDGGDQEGSCSGGKEAYMPSRTGDSGLGKPGDSLGDNLTDSGCVIDNDDDCGIFKME
ncbi:calmodulin-binding transcription activator 1 [Biomphalaria glabrata]|nr:calmodulin-binding transcription activator 1 [Biomphalaria glabrata]